MAIYTYHINLDERGDFSADVRRGGCNGPTVYEIHGFDVFEDGFMNQKNDIAGLQEHLYGLGIFGKEDRIGTEEEAEAEGKQVYEVKVTRTVTTYFYREQVADNPTQAKVLAADHASRHVEQWQFQTVEYAAEIADE
jgi:hypothetical protein